MKSDERHELKRNDLAEGLSDLPALWARHGNKVLIAVTVALLAFAAVRYRNGQALQRESEAQQMLANAWSGVDQISRLTAGPASAEIDKMRTGLTSEINQSVQSVLDSSPNATQAAWAWLARGEMYWALAHANREAPATSTSQPASQPAIDATALASTAYNTVVSQYASAGEPAEIARFGLAAVAEETGKFAEARTQYKAVIETPNVLPTNKSIATARLTRLDTLEKPLLLLPASQPAAGVDLMQSMPGFSPLGGAFPPAPSTPNPRPAASQTAR